MPAFPLLFCIQSGFVLSGGGGRGGGTEQEDKPKDSKIPGSSSKIVRGEGGKLYTANGDLWEFYNYSPEIRRAIYTTNAIEPLNFRLRKVTNSRQALVNYEAILKVLFLAIRNASGKWTMPVRHWWLP